MQRLTAIRLCALLVALVLLSTASLSLAAQVPNTLTIGVISGVGSATAHGVHLTEDRFNAHGPTTLPDGSSYKWVVAERDANTAAEVQNAINELKTAGAVAIFGPDNDELAAASQNAMLGAGLPVFTGATTNAITPTGSVFRTRADESRVMSAYAQYISTDLGKTKIAIFQGDALAAGPVTLFTTSLGQLGKTPATTVLQVQGGALKDSARVLLGANPDIVVAFGGDEQAALLLRELRGQGYNGQYAYPNAQNRLFIMSLPPDLRVDIVGVDNWTYANPTSVSGEFTRDYVALFGEVPNGLSAASYDAAAAVIIAASRVGVQPEALTRGILALPRVDSIQGTFNAAGGTNSLSSDVFTFETGPYGAPVVKMRFDESGKAQIGGGAVPLPTLVPTSPPVPPTNPPPPTPEGVTAQPKNSLLNVRTGPGTNFGILGQLRQSDIVQVIGIAPTQDWLVINFVGQTGWIQRSLAIVNGNIASVPIIQPPPSPTPPPTPTAQPFPDLVPLSVVLNPPQPKVGQPFVASVVIRNQGGANAGKFAVAASWLPGDVFTSSFVDGLAAGQATTVNLNVPGVSGPGTFTVTVVVDLNKDVDEGPNGKNNNNIPITYSVIP